MPTYDYRCKNCGHRFEEFQSMKADPLVTCPNCNEPALERLIGAGGGMIFKGSGFYLTDYKGSNASAKPAGSTSPAPPSSPASDSSSASSSAAPSAKE